MLEVRGLTKRYTGRPVVNNVSFVIERGEVLGYLGPNGSGKSTTVKMLVGLVQPSEGRVLLDGRDVAQDTIGFRRRLGYVPEEPDVYSYLSGREYLQLVGRLRVMPEILLNRKIDELLQLFHIHPHRHAPISSYSKGMKQKVLISAALLHNPEVVVFDEPLSGLDVTSALVFRDLVKLLAREGRIILYSSHVLEAIEKTCSKVIILHKGAVVANGRVEHLRGLMKLPSLEEIFSQLVLQEDTAKTALDIVDVIKSQA